MLADMATRLAMTASDWQTWCFLSASLSSLHAVNQPTLRFSLMTLPRLEAVWIPQRQCCLAWLHSRFFSTTPRGASEQARTLPGRDTASPLVVLWLLTPPGWRDQIARPCIVPVSKPGARWLSITGIHTPTQWILVPPVMMIIRPPHRSVVYLALFNSQRDTTTAERVRTGCTMEAVLQPSDV